MIVVELPVPDEAVSVPGVLQPHPVLQPDACMVREDVKGGGIKCTRCEKVILRK
jgi:hypothetical protein